MRRFLLLVALCLCISSAKADVFNLTINSADTNDGNYFVGFYHSTLRINDNVSVPLLTICVDFTDHVGFGESFAVTPVNLHDYVGPMHDNYWEAGYLALLLQTTNDATVISNIQRAIWLITTPGTSDSYLTTLASFDFANQAALNFHSVSDSNFVLYLRSGDNGQVQLSVVPEPSTYAFVCAGTISLLGFRRLFRVR